jgi:hypothetical protein
MRLFSSRLTSGRSRTPRTRLNIAALAPMPRASVRITVMVRPLARARERAPNVLRSTFYVLRLTSAAPFRSVAPRICSEGMADGVCQPPSGAPWIAIQPDPLPEAPADSFEPASPESPALSAVRVGGHQLVHHRQTASLRRPSYWFKFRVRAGQGLVLSRWFDGRFSCSFFGTGGMN